MDTRARAALLAPRPDGTPTPEVVRTATPARRLRDVTEPLAMHAVWSPLTNERLAALGLEFLGAYVAGRASSLGTPVGAVVASTFAWFEPSLITSRYDAAVVAVRRDELMAVRDEATTASLRHILGDDDPTDVADLLSDATEAAEGSGRPLFSALRSRGRPADPVQRLWWACDLVREHRGDSHVAAATAAGIGPVEMNILTELWLGMPLLTYSATRGWSPDTLHAAVGTLQERGWMDGEQITEAGRVTCSGIEAVTDAQEQSIVDALGDRLDETCVRLDGWSALCIEAGTFPADILKRAAG